MVQQPQRLPATSQTDEQFMHLALQEARVAAALGEVPVGAIIVRHGQVIAAAYNQRETDGNALAHAECLAISRACQMRGGWQLWDCEMYVTLEPCPMCAGAIINSRLRRVVYGAKDAKAGCCGSVTDLFSLPFNHIPQIVPDICGEECQALLQKFFQQLRLRLKTAPQRKLSPVLPATEKSAIGSTKILPRPGK